MPVKQDNENSNYYTQEQRYQHYPFMNIRPALAEDLEEIFALYRAVARIPGGLARLESEVSKDYVENFLTQSLVQGLCLVAEDEDGVVCGEIHAYTPGLFCFSHVLSELTIAVHPDQQGKGIGRELFVAFMENVEHEQSKFDRVELIARQSNEKAIAFYESLGFRKEGELLGRIKNPDGSLESDIPMAWQRNV